MVAHTRQRFRYNATMERNRPDARTSPWVTRSITAVIGVAMLLLAYMLSIGPVYFVWARCSADMDTHQTIEGFYAPLLKHGPSWLTDYRDVSRIAGHRPNE